MTVQRIGWLSALGIALGLPAMSVAQNMVWRAVARTPPQPVLVATSAKVPESSPRPTVTPSEPMAALGRPTPISSPRAGSAGTALAVIAAGPNRSPVVSQVPHAGQVPTRVGPIVRGQSGEGALPLYMHPGAVMPARNPAPVPSANIPDRRHVSAVTPVSANWNNDGPIQSANQSDPPTVPGIGGGPDVPVQPPWGKGYTKHTVSGPPDSLPAPDGSPVELMPGVVTDRPVAPGFWERCRGWMRFTEGGCSAGRCSFQSDGNFPGLISPVTMPFYFEDPRALTEVRPIFMYQSLTNNVAGGGSAVFFGTQARLAFNEQWSLVVSELGFLSLQPDNPALQSGTGFAEIKLGPKFTFWRDPNLGSVAAFGVNFELPVGSAKVLQNNGTLSIDPYLSYGQTFGRLPDGYGSFNFLGTLGYSFSVNNQRSEFVYANLHLDYNVANANTIFPLIELNWIHYTKSGQNGPFGTEGADLVNLGSSTRQGNNYLSLAAGLRYRFSDAVWAGAAIEFPVSNEKGLSDYRLTFDVIFRY